MTEEDRYVVTGDNWQRWMAMGHDGPPRSPLRQVLRAITGKKPPTWTRRIYASTDLDEEHQELLQSWCVNNARPFWSTGIGIMDAADKMVAEAVSNGNIPPPEFWEESGER